MIAIKPHHFVDIITALGAGTLQFEPHPYGHAVHTVAKQIVHQPDVALRIELGADDICGPCRHNVGGLCDDTIDTSLRPTAPVSKREWNLLIDRRWCERVGIEQDDILTARQFCQRLQRSMGDLADIYRELPPALARERRTKLETGISMLLGIESPRTHKSSK